LSARTGSAARLRSANAPFDWDACGCGPGQIHALADSSFLVDDLRWPSGHRDLRHLARAPVRQVAAAPVVEDGHVVE